MFYCQQGQDSTSKPPFIRGTDTVMERFSCFAARSGRVTGLPRAARTITPYCISTPEGLFHTLHSTPT